MNIFVTGRGYKNYRRFAVR